MVIVKIVKSILDVDNKQYVMSFISVLPKDNAVLWPHLRRGGDNLEKLILQGKVDGKRPRGRAPRSWIDQITEINQTPLKDTIRETKCRKSMTAFDKISILGSERSVVSETYLNTISVTYQTETAFAINKKTQVPVTLETKNYEKSIVTLRQLDS